MDETLRQLGGLLLGSVPTIIFMVLVFGLYTSLVHKPLVRVLTERHAKTQGAVEKARADIAAAEARTADYEQRIREARLGIFKAQEGRRQQALQARATAVAAARARANEQIEAARKLALAAEGAPQEKSGWFGFWWDGIEEKVRGGISEDPRELKKYLIHSTQPAYPEIAKKAGIEGRVRLQVRVGTDGRVEVLKVLEGEPVLADAAIAAVKQWQYRPKQLNGKRVNVISEVSVGFQLH